MRLLQPHASTNFLRTQEEAEWLIALLPLCLFAHNGVQAVRDCLLGFGGRRLWFLWVGFFRVKLRSAALEGDVAACSAGCVPGLS